MLEARQKRDKDSRRGQKEVCTAKKGLIYNNIKE
jgi:hypothetical protein